MPRLAKAAAVLSFSVIVHFVASVRRAGIVAFLVLKEGGHLVAATEPVSQEETARHRVSGAMMRLAPSADGLGRIARLLEEGTIRPDVATVYALPEAAEAWKEIAGNRSPREPGAARRRSHGKIVLRVA